MLDQLLFEMLQLMTLTPFKPKIRRSDGGKNFSTDLVAPFALSVDFCAV